MKIKVTTPQNVYISKNSSILAESSDEYIRMLKITTTCRNGDYLWFSTDQDGNVFIPAELVQQSVFELVH